MKTICMFGTGSLGANTCINIARKWSEEVEFILIDYDTIETRNLANQPWYDVNVGQRKASVLSAHLYRVAKTSSKVIIKKVEDAQAFASEFHKLLSTADVFVDCFDNMRARHLTQVIQTGWEAPILHSGFSEIACMMRWGTSYPIDPNAAPRAPVCDRRDLATLVTLGAAMTEAVISEYLTTGNLVEKFIEVRGVDIQIW